MILVGELSLWVALLMAAWAATVSFAGGQMRRGDLIESGERAVYATLAMVPFQFSSYMAGSLWLVVPSFIMMQTLGSMFFGPSFAMSQGLAPLRMRAVATSLVLFS